MCGIFGAIGSKPSLAILRSLAIANRDRGTHSLGFFDSRRRIFKRAGDPTDVLLLAGCTTWLNESADSSWFIGGHTRYATRGARTTANAHPFRCGRFIVTHNGTVSAPRKFAVDSQWFPHLLKSYHGDYQRAFAKVDGYWGLSWTDGDTLTLQTWHNDIAFVLHDGVTYYSSDWRHLAACTGEPIKRITAMHQQGDTWRFFPDGSMSQLPAFTPPDMFVEKRQSFLPYRDYDKAWLDDWNDYRTREDDDYALMD